MDNLEMDERDRIKNMLNEMVEQESDLDKFDESTRLSGALIAKMFDLNVGSGPSNEGSNRFGGRKSNAAPSFGFTMDNTAPSFGFSADEDFGASGMSNDGYSGYDVEFSGDAGQGSYSGRKNKDTISVTDEGMFGGKNSLKLESVQEETQSEDLPVLFRKGPPERNKQAANRQMNPSPAMGHDDMGGFQGEQPSSSFVLSPNASYSFNANAVQGAAPHDVGAEMEFYPPAENPSYQAADVNYNYGAENMQYPIQQMPYQNMQYPAQQVPYQNMQYPAQQMPYQGMPYPAQQMPYQNMVYPAQQMMYQGVPYPAQQVPYQNMQYPAQQMPYQGVPPYPSQNTPETLSQASASTTILPAREILEQEAKAQEAMLQQVSVEEISDLGDIDNGVFESTAVPETNFMDIQAPTTDAFSIGESVQEPTGQPESFTTPEPFAAPEPFALPEALEQVGDVQYSGFNNQGDNTYSTSGAGTAVGYKITEKPFAAVGEQYGIEESVEAPARVEEDVSLPPSSFTGMDVKNSSNTEKGQIIDFSLLSSLRDNADSDDDLDTLSAGLSGFSVRPEKQEVDSGGGFLFENMTMNAKNYKQKMADADNTAIEPEVQQVPQPAQQQAAPAPQQVAPVAQQVVQQPAPQQVAPVSQQVIQQPAPAPQQAAPVAQQVVQQPAPQQAAPVAQQVVQQPAPAPQQAAPVAQQVVQQPAPQQAAPVAQQVVQQPAPQQTAPIAPQEVAHTPQQAAENKAINDNLLLPDISYVSEILNTGRSGYSISEFLIDKNPTSKKIVNITGFWYINKSASAELYSMAYKAEALGDEEGKIRTLAAMAMYSIDVSYTQKALNDVKELVKDENEIGSLCKVIMSKEDNLLAYFKDLENYNERGANYNVQ